MAPVPQMAAAVAVPWAAPPCLTIAPPPIVGPRSPPMRTRTCRFTATPAYPGKPVGVPGRDRRTVGDASLPCRGLLDLGPAVLPGSAAAAKVSGAVDECHVGECLGEVADEAAVFQVVFL